VTAARPAPGPLPDGTAWQALDLPAVLARLAGRPGGLSAAEAAGRLQTHGPNRLPEEPPPSRWRILLRQFRSPLIYILLVAAAASLALGESLDAAFIAAALLLNALIGGYEEWRSEKSTRALQRLLRIHATVVRDGESLQVGAEEVVPGDLVLLEPGNRVPADIRLARAHGLEIDESLLTGESLPVAKDPGWIGAASIPLADHRNMAYAGSIVIRGRGRGYVVATGAATGVGQLALAVIGAAAAKPPLVRRLERFARVIAHVVMAAVVLISLWGVLVRGDRIAEVFMFGVALAVSAIPEGLPVAITVALAIVTTRMAQRGVIVRRLAAVEGLGSCTLIASDKTGTLTCNELTVREIRLPGGGVYGVSGEGYAPDGQVLEGTRPVAARGHAGLAALARAAVLCNEGSLDHHRDHWVWRGDPTDVALLAMARKLGLDRRATLDLHPLVQDIPFEPENRFAASWHEVDKAVRVFVKGAPERVLAMCDAADDPAALAAALEAAESMAERGFRVLALAEGAGEPRETPAPPASSGPEAAAPPPRPAASGPRPAGSGPPPAPSGLTFLGLAGMIDPLRPGAREAVAACQAAGITVCMITGDHPVTALAIARELGFASRPEQVVTGADLARAGPDGLRDLVRESRVFARTAPHQKLRIVQAAQAAGHFVAVTGDGVNDAPALRAADIGVAMGKEGTDVAREAAELVISDDNFATIVAGVEEGRVAYDNVRKVIYLLISTGAAEVLLVILTLMAGLPLPLLPVQLLWLNLVTNGIQDIALAFEPNEGDVLRRRPRAPGERIIDRVMLERTVVGALGMGCVSFAAFWWAIRAGWSEAAARNAVLLLMVLFENFHVWNCRSETRYAVRMSPLRSPVLFAGTLAAFLVHLAAMYVPLGQRVLRTEPVGAGSWAALVGLGATILVIMEIDKAARARRGTRSGAP
jgi:magnesium-transporting ATPase (P-type)